MHIYCFCEIICVKAQILESRIQNTLIGSCLSFFHLLPYVIYIFIHDNNIIMPKRNGLACMSSCCEMTYPGKRLKLRK